MEEEAVEEKHKTSRAVKTYQAWFSEGWVDGRMDGWMDGRMDGWMDGWMGNG